MEQPFTLDVDLAQEDAVRSSPIEIEPNVWEVRSKSKKDTWHTVRVLTGGVGFSCDCTGYHFRKWCDHCEQVRDEVVIERCAAPDPIDITFGELLI